LQFNIYSGKFITEERKNENAFTLLYTIIAEILSPHQKNKKGAVVRGRGMNQVVMLLRKRI